MPERKSTPIEMVVATTDEIQGAIERIAREGAKKLLQAALEAEVEEHLSRYEHIKDAEGHRHGEEWRRASPLDPDRGGTGGGKASTNR